LLEVAANAAMAVSVVLAGRNSVHTWWAGMLGCALFAVVFWRAQLYANVTLQVFLIATSAVGWWRWLRHEQAPASELRAGRRPVYLLLAAGAGGLVALGYGAWLATHTEAYAPFWDALVVMFSVIAQLLLLRRRVESWWFWLVVNVIAIPLFASRGLYLTSLLYAGYLVNAALALRHWRALEHREHGRQAA
jgi:nicotinamide mononucleotide transporter